MITYENVTKRQRQVLLDFRLNFFKNKLLHSWRCHMCRRWSSLMLLILCESKQQSQRKMWTITHIPKKRTDNDPMMVMRKKRHVMNMDDVGNTSINTEYVCFLRDDIFVLFCFFFDGKLRTAQINPIDSWFDHKTKKSTKKQALWCDEVKLWIGKQDAKFLGTPDIGKSIGMGK